MHPVHKMAVAIKGATDNRGKTSGTTKLGSTETTGLESTGTCGLGTAGLGSTETPRLGTICLGNAGSGSVVAGVVNGETSSVAIEAWGMQAFQKYIGDSMEALLNPTVQGECTSPRA